MKKKRETNLKNNKNQEFIIRGSQKGSNHSNKSGFNKSNMIAPHELASAKNGMKSRGGSRVKESSKINESQQKQIE